MQSIKLIIVVILCLLSVTTFGQGVPKAYEGIIYHGKVNGRLVRLLLANGYIGASSLKLDMAGQKKPIVFQPDGGAADEHNRLKFVAVKKGDQNYFILNNIQDAYEEIPAVITGIYFTVGKTIAVTFRLIKRYKR